MTKCELIVRIMSETLENPPKIIKWLKTFEDTEPSANLVDIPRKRYKIDIRKYDTDERLEWLENYIGFTKFEVVRQLRVLSKYAEAVLQRDEVITVWMP